MQTLEAPAIATSNVKVNMSLKIAPSEKIALQNIARSKDRTVHHLMRQVVSDYIKTEQSRIAFYEAGKKSIAEYKATGLHVTMAEMRAWADSLGTPNELPKPICHT